MTAVASKTLYFALIGFLALVLIGPILGMIVTVFLLIFHLVAALLPLVIIGFLIWLPFRLAQKGSRETWDEIGQTSRKASAAVVKPMRHCFQAYRMTWGVGQSAWTRFRPEKQTRPEKDTPQAEFVHVEADVAVLQPAPRTSRRVLEYVVELFSGALTGMLVGFLWAWQTQQSPILGVVGAGAGTVLGGLVAISRRLG